MAQAQIFVVEPWMWGVFLCVVSAFLTAFGLVLQKYSHIQNAKGTERVVYYRQPAWLIGFVFFLVGQVINVWAMAMAPQIIISCLGAWSLIFNAAFARALLSEVVRAVQLVAMAGIIGGVILVIYRTPTSEHVHEGTVNEIAAALVDPAFLALAAGLVGGLSVAWCAVTRFRPNYVAFYWAVVSAALSGYTVAVFKCVSLLLALGRAPWGNWEFYAVLAAGAVLCPAQLHVLNLALRLGSAVVVVPTSFALGMLMQILTAHLAFKELRGFATWEEGAGFWLGVGIVLLATSVMARSKISAEAEAAGPMPSELEYGEDEGKQASEATSLLTEAQRLLSPSMRTPTSTSLDASAFRQSFDGGERFYIAGPNVQSGVM